MFLTKRERNKQADVLEKVMAMKALADAEELIENEREWMDEVRV